MGRSSQLRHRRTSFNDEPEPGPRASLGTPKQKHPSVPEARPSPYRHSATVHPVSNLYRKPGLSLKGEEGTFTAMEFSSKRVQPSLKTRVKKYLATSNVGIMIDVLSSSFSAIACLFFIWESYEEDMRNIFRYFEVFFCMFFMFELALRFFVAHNRKKLFLTGSTMIDIVTIFPIIFDVLLIIKDQRVLSSEWTKFFRFVRVFRVIRILRLHRMFTYYDSEIARETAKFVLNIFSISLISAATVFSLENVFREEMWLEELQFHDAFYFTIVTISTVGYGDVKTYTDSGRFFISVVILCSLIYIPMSTNTLLKLIAEKSEYSIKSFRPVVQLSHVLVCGELHPDGAREFLREFFHPDHGSSIDYHVVFLMEKPPSSELRAVIESQRYALVVTYIQGSVYSEHDLERARAFEASAFFILANKLTLNEEKTDTDSLLKALAIKQYIRKTSQKDPKICIQLIRPENKKRYVKSFASNKAIKPTLQGGKKDVFSGASTDLIVCVNQIKMRLLAKSCICPGIISLISNLIVSTDTSSSRATGRNTPDWQREFRRGCDFEIYRTKLGPSFSRISFKELAFAVFQETETLVIGLEIHWSNPYRDQVHVLLNPHDYKIPDLNKYKVFALVIARDKTAADLNKMFRTQMLEDQSSRFGSSFFKAPAAGRNRDLSTGGGGEASRSALYTANKKASVLDIFNKHLPEGIVLPRTDSSMSIASHSSARKEDPDSKTSNMPVFVPIERATIKTSLFVEQPDVTGHFIFTGSTKNLKAFVEVLRDRAMGGCKEIVPIVILNSEPPSEQVWLSMSTQGMYYIEGSPLDAYDLRRAGVEYARCAVIAAWDVEQEEWENKEDDSFGETNIVQQNEVTAATDADAIFAHQGIKRLNPDIEIITELINMTNIVFLETKSQAMHQRVDQTKDREGVIAPRQDRERSLGGILHEELPEFDAVDSADIHAEGLLASGTVFTLSLLDALICQCFYNPQILTVIEHLISSSEVGHANEDAEFDLADEPWLPSRCHLYRIPVPREYYNKTYGSLFSHLLLEKNTLPIGICRGLNAKRIGLGLAGNRHPFVVTNPDKSAVLHAVDFVYVLAQEEPVLQAPKTNIAHIVSSMTRRHLDISPPASKSSKALNNIAGNKQLSSFFALQNLQ